MTSGRAFLVLGILAAVLAVGPGWREAESDDQSPLSVGDALVQSAESAIGPSEEPAGMEPLVVHEWGTFTSFSGSDGIKLEFRPLVENDLPSFVFNRAKQTGNWLGKFSITALQRMETPVTYFYTPVERDVSVRVEFPKGLLTEFYPPAREIAPEFALSKDGALARLFSGVSEEGQVELKDSMIDWGTVHLIPPESLHADVADRELAARIGRHVEQTMTPEAQRFPHYATARETDSAIIQSRHLARNGNKYWPIPAADYFEKFLFYRGVGNFELPLTLEAGPDGRYELTNSGADEIRSLFLVSVVGEEIRFKHYDGIDGHSSLVLEQSQDVQTVDGLAAAVAKALTSEGLYEKEAWAMVNTWKLSWFGEEGTRLFYSVPARITDELLPLHIEPQPDELVRVLIGRLEIMTPGEEQRVLELVARSASSRQTSDSAEAFRSPVMDDLLAMGRLAEPALVRAKNVSDDEALQNEAGILLHELRREYEQRNEG